MKKYVMNNKICWHYWYYYSVISNTNVSEIIVYSCATTDFKKIRCKFYKSNQVLIHFINAYIITNGTCKIKE